MSIRRTLLIGIIVIAAAIRLWRLGSIPPALSWDEAAIGYNAWSVLQTGNDEWGEPFPLLFRSFDDYKLPGLIYSVALSEAVFGLTAFAVRLPTALFGVGIVVIGYMLAGKLLSYQTNRTNETYTAQYTALFAAFLLAVSPWLISFSRQAFESLASLFFVMLGVYGLTCFERQPRFILFSAVAFAASLYFYYAARVVVPVILLIFIIVYWKHLWKRRHLAVLAAVLGIIIIAPLIPAVLSVGGFSRISQVVVTNEPEYIERMTAYTNGIVDHDNAWWTRIVYNRRFALVETVAYNYLQNISPVFLFINGTEPHGLLYLWELPLLFLGLYALFRLNGSTKWILFAWLLAAPLAGALTKDQPNALRTLIGAPAFVMVSALGVREGLGMLGKLGWLGKLGKLGSLGGLGMFGILVTVFAVRFFFLYFDLVPRTRPMDFGDGYPQMAKYAQSAEDDYDTIWVSGYYWRPYIHVLFHQQINPSVYQESGSPGRLGKYRFGGASWDPEGPFLDSAALNELVEGKTLFILSGHDYRSQLNEEAPFSYAEPIDGIYAKEVFWAVVL